MKLSPELKLEVPPCDAEKEREACAREGGECVLISKP